jgi:hypothetical protein
MKPLRFIVIGVFACGCILAVRAPAADVDSKARHWAFQPVQRPPLPAVRKVGWCRNELDRFILARLEADQLAPAPEADRRTLIRRLCFDLVGLPPTPKEVEDFLRDSSPSAYEKLVERLLASPRHGERWARHWLDVVRFAESHGFERNQPRPYAWPYRDYVIRAFNEDKPYDQFLREQLAGDGLGVGAATAFLVAGPNDQVPSPDPVLTAQQRADEIHDMVSTTGSALLGVTLGCARCHNHKFDPITQTDYYAVAAVFAGVRHGDRFLPPSTHDIRWRQVRERELPLSALERMLDPSGARPSWGALLAQRKLAAYPVAYAGCFELPGPTHRLYRGDPMQPREIVVPGAIAALGKPLEHDCDSESSRRLALGRWITDPRNPLTARVMVNRLWHYHFGEGIVSTPSDFGINGARPTHPDLLDWLAAELVAGNWSLKAIHRRIVLSSTYRQSGQTNAHGLAVDAGDRLLWRFPPRRLEAEPLRDAILAVCGNLDRRMEGSGFDLFEPSTRYVKIYTAKTQFGPAEWRRMIYQSKPRLQLDSVFGAFDCPDAGQIAPKRTRSTTPLQALNLRNSPFIVRQAQLFADRLEGEAGSEPRRQAELAFRLAFAREAAPEEAQAAATLIQAEGLLVFCRALLNANEFVYVY